MTPSCARFIYSIFLIISTPVAALAKDFSADEVASLLGTLIDPTKSGYSRHSILNDANGFDEVGSGALPGGCDTGLSHYKGRTFQVLIVVESLKCQPNSFVQNVDHRIVVRDALALHLGLRVFGYEGSGPPCFPVPSVPEMIIAGHEWKERNAIFLRPIQLAWSFDHVKKRLIPTTPPAGECKIDLSDFD